jgi:PAS domain S-box-containing protein
MVSTPAGKPAEHGPALRVLFVEDRPADVELNLRALEDGGFEIASDTVETAEEFKRLLRSKHYDIVLVDYGLPGWTGLDAIRMLKDAGQDIPVIVVTGSLGDEAAVECIKAGAADYVLKNLLSRLPFAVRRALEEKALREERVRAEAALRESEERFRIVGRATNDAVWDWDLVTDALSWGEGFTQLFGYQPDQIEPGIESWYAGIHPEDKDRVLSGIEGVIRGGGRRWSDEYRFRRADGSYASIFDRGYVIHDDAGKPVRMIGAMMDITERHRAEEALRASEERFRRIVETAEEGIWVSDGENKTTFANKKMANMLGYTQEEMTGMSLFDLMEEEERALAAHNVERRRAGISEQHEFKFRRKDGSPLWAFLATGPVLNEAGQYAGSLAMVTDMTQRRQLEEQLRQAQKMEAVGRLGGGIAHDFNNLLTIISGYSELLLERLEADNPMRGQAEQIKKAGDRAAALTRQLLAFSRQQVLVPQVLDLNHVVANTLSMLRRLIGEDVELVAVEGPGLGRVKADPGQLEQVIMNLAVNARDAMPRGGRLTLETANAELDETYARSHFPIQPGPYVMLAVSDTGCGMEAETQAHIFEPFFTTKDKGKGTGLGLAMVYGIIKQSGGYIWCCSEVGQGTAFKIYLPRVEEVEEMKGKVGVWVAPERCTETVLVVEDEPEVRQLARRILAAQGYQVLEARHGEDALLVCEQHPGPIHLLLTDVVMPEMGGPELAERLAPFRREMKVLYMSGYTDDAVVHHGVLTSGAAYLQKPFTPEALARKVWEVLRGPLASAA